MKNNPFSLRSALRNFTLQNCQTSYNPALVRLPRPAIVVKWAQTRGLVVTSVNAQESITPLRKHQKDEIKRRKAAKRDSDAVQQDGQNGVDEKEKASEWELTVGLEIHAEVNTAQKLFSEAQTTANQVEWDTVTPNKHVAPFDASLPGSQPRFQPATLVPAIRAALALNCVVQRRSSWDRKHYFHWDQPNGYQITQFYEPLAKDGHFTLSPAVDGIDASDLPPGQNVLTIGIKQIQMEQDTAKTTTSQHQHCVDLNRAGHPLIEIITLPHIHSPHTAAIAVRKIQSLLRAVDACTTGMELGGLRADVNVSIRRRGGRPGTQSYAGVTGLGTRTEIKNLASFKAVEDAITAERDRQIAVLEAGGEVRGETRGWALGATETTRLRGKEGEVDYRYMPDADLPPVLVTEDVVIFLNDTLPELPDATIERVQAEYGLTLKDARTVVSLDDGERLEFLEETVNMLMARLHAEGADKLKLGRLAGNWVLHEIGGLSTTAEWKKANVTSADLADILTNLTKKHITARVAKQLLAKVYEASDTGPRLSVEQMIEEGNLRLRPLSDQEYKSLARSIMDSNPKMVADVKDKGQKGKIMWFVGQMIRHAKEGTVEPEKARQIVEGLFEMYQ